MMPFAVVFPDEKIVVSVIRQLSWRHILAIIPIGDTLKREFYIEMCKIIKKISNCSPHLDVKSTAESPTNCDQWVNTLVVHGL